MNEIRPGIWVEVVDDPCWMNESMRKFIGEKGEVLKASDVYEDNWIVRGLEVDPDDGMAMHFIAKTLRPINDGTVGKLIEKWQRESRQGVPA